MIGQHRAKIVSLDRLREVVADARAAGQTIVQCHGCFDIVHPGHVRYLEFARRQGDLLIVTLTGDAHVEKGAERPYIPEDLRAENVAALIFVDYVCVTGDPTAETALTAIQPDVYVKGREYEHSRDPRFLAEKRTVERYGGRLIFSSGEIVLGSTALIEQLSPSAELEHHHLRSTCGRHGLTLDGLTGRMSRFRELNVLVVGDLILDRYILCDPLGVAAESPMISLAPRDERLYVGGAAIVARHVAALGANVSLVTAGADDATTQGVVETLHHEGVSTEIVRNRSQLVEKTRFLADDTKLFKVDKASCQPLDSLAERRAAQILEHRSRQAQVVILCDFGYGMITSGLLGRVLPTIRHNTPLLTADVSGGRANLLNFRNVDLLCPTELEARATLNDYDAGLSAVAWRLLDRTQARHLLVTLEKRGMVIFERASQRRDDPDWSGRLKSEAWPTFASRSIDRLGCGDALLAAASLTLATGGSLMESAYLGNGAAAVEIGMLGNVPISAPALREWLGTRSELNPIRSRPAVSVIGPVDRVSPQPAQGFARSTDSQ